YFKQSNLFVGYRMVDLPDISDLANNQTAGNWEGTFSLGTFKTTAVFNSADVADSAGFQGSNVIAGSLGTTTLSGLNSAALIDQVFFGVGFRGTAHGTLTINGVSKTPSSTPIGAFLYNGLSG